jgi:hypothetical protein
MHYRCTDQTANKNQLLAADSANGLRTHMQYRLYMYTSRRHNRCVNLRVGRVGCEAIVWCIMKLLITLLRERISQHSIRVLLREFAARKKTATRTHFKYRSRNENAAWIKNVLSVIDTSAKRFIDKVIYTDQLGRCS